MAETTYPAATLRQASDGLLRADYRLDDSLWGQSGAIFLTGTQALVRLMLMQRRRDAAEARCGR